MDKKKILIIVGVAIVLYLLLRNSSDSKSKDETEAGNAFSNAADALTSGISTVATATSVQKTQEDEEYQNLLAEYKRLNGGTLPRGATSLTYAQLQTAIKSLKELQVAINNYHEIEDDSIQMSTEELMANGIDTVEKVVALINDVKIRQKKEAWNKRKKYIEGIVNAFYDNMTNVGTWLGDCKGYATGTFNDLINLVENERVYANQYFGTLGGVDVGYSWLKITKHPVRAYTIADAIPEIGESVDRDRASHSQVGKSAAMAMSSKLKSEYSGVSGTVNDFGEIYK